MSWYELSEPEMIEARGPYAKKYCWRIDITLKPNNIHDKKRTSCGFMETVSFDNKKDAKKYLKEGGWIGMANGKGGYCVPKIDPDPHKVAEAVIQKELLYSAQLAAKNNLWHAYQRRLEIKRQLRRDILWNFMERGTTPISEEHQNELKRMIKENLFEERGGDTIRLTDEGLKLLQKEFYN